MKFELFFKYENSKSAGPYYKTFNTKNTNRAWGLARRWAQIATDICGRHLETNEAASGWELKLMKEA